jgi:cytoskeletal protein CcmA (bactofilin family)
MSNQESESHMAWGNKSSDVATPTRGSGALSFIGSEVTITGNISGDGDIHLDGTIEGDCTCNSLILGSGGRIRGNINAAKATLGGTVDGTVNARTLTVEKSARVQGDLVYENVTIENGAQVDGRLTQRGGDAGLKLVASGD